MLGIELGALAPKPHDIPLCQCDQIERNSYCENLIFFKCNGIWWPLLFYLCNYIYFQNNKISPLLGIELGAPAPKHHDIPMCHCDPIEQNGYNENLKNGLTLF